MSDSQKVEFFKENLIVYNEFKDVKVSDIFSSNSYHYAIECNKTLIHKARSQRYSLRNFNI